MEIVSHSCGAVIPRFGKEGLEILQMDYVQKRHTTRRHMMETGETGESVLETLQNGLRDEISDGTEFVYRFLEDEPCFVKFGKDDGGKGYHLKVFFLVSFEGAMRQSVKEDVNSDGTVDRIGPPQFMELKELLHFGKAGTTATHYGATYGALNLLAKNPRFFARYPDIVFKLSARKELAPYQLQAIADYSHSWL